MENLIYSPPVVILIFFALFFAASKILARYSRHGIRGAYQSESYACGQRNIQNYVNPDYSEFFPFAFFFTIMHVVVLVVATAPRDVIALPVVFILSSVVAMAIIFRR